MGTAQGSSGCGIRMALIRYCAPRLLNRCKRCGHGARNFCTWFHYNRPRTELTPYESRSRNWDSAIRTICLSAHGAGSKKPGPESTARRPGPHGPDPESYTPPPPPSPRRGPWLGGVGARELGAGVLGQIKYRALPAAFDVTEVHRGTPIGPALCRAVLGVQDNQHRQTGASRKGSGSHLAASAGCRLVLVGLVPRGQVVLVIRGVLRAIGPRGCKWAQAIAAPRCFPLHPV